MLLNLLFLVFGIVLLFAAVKMGQKIIELYQCPDEDLLLDYYKGKLSKKEDLRRKVIAHLGVCEKCQQKMINLKDEKRDLEKHLVDS